MLDRSSANQEDKGKNEQHYVDALDALSARAEAVSKQVQEIKDSLASAYAAEALSNISQKFETISMSFTNYARIKSNMFYEIIHRSEARLSAVDSIAREASNIAQLFERYAKAPESYSASNSRTEINKLQAELVNLKDASTPKPNKPVS